MSLSDCITKFGKVFSQEERAELSKARDANVAAGMSVREAEFAAVEGLHAAALSERNTVLDAISKEIDEEKEARLYEAAMRNLPTRLETMLAEVYLPPKATVLNDPRYQLKYIAYQIFQKE